MSAFKVLTVPDFTDTRGSLYVLDQFLPFEIERVFYILNGSQKRGGHRHYKTRQAMICLSGSVDIYMNNGKVAETIRLDDPKQCLIIEPEDWHHMENFSKDAVLVVFASAAFDFKDYITEPYA
jgi:dTDP-4-dehydrorhamnose 3,5-epimerase-like enzyme